MKSKAVVIAIDGPAGTGKSTVTKLLCEKLGYQHIDTGAIYRCVALQLLSMHSRDELKKWEGENSQKLDKAAELAAGTADIRFERRVGEVQQVLLNEKNVTHLIRTPEIGALASRVSRVAGVRSALLGFQRELGNKAASILEGRDIGTVVFPEAPIKFFLTASLKARAERRFLELEAMGSASPNLQEVSEQIQKRDFEDTHRKVAPLKQAPDAILLDTSDMSAEEVVQAMLIEIRARGL